MRRSKHARRRPAPLGVNAFAPHETISTPRLLLTPLRPADADDMVDVLGDERLHEFTGGSPATLDDLRDRFAGLAAGSPDPAEVWFNWIVRGGADARPVGTVQATLSRDGEAWVATVAWIIGVAWQRRGFASEAATALVEWLRAHGAETVDAHIRRDHRVSAAVALRAGLRPTEEEADGEQVWRARLRP